MVLLGDMDTAYKLLIGEDRGNNSLITDEQVAAPAGEAPLRGQRNLPKATHRRDREAHPEGYSSPHAEKIITDNVEIYELLEQNEKEADLFDCLIALVRTPEEPHEPQLENKEVLASVEQEEASSPWGEFLRRKKNNNQNKHKYETNAIKELLNPQKA
jgi:hypothetical protein